MKTLYSFLVFVMIFGLACCEKSKVEVDSFIIEYIIGSSWVDYEYSLNMDQTGIMHVKFHDNDYYRENYYQVDNEKIDALKEELALLSTIELQDQYGFGDDKPTDLPVSFYRYRTNIRSDSTYIYFPEENELPDELLSFIHSLNKIIIEVDSLRY